MFFLFMKRGDAKISRKNLVSCTLVGTFFATCNLLNTFLAGRLDSSVFFPLINIGSILFSMIFGFIVYKEKITKRDIVVLVLAISAIILISIN